MGIRYEVFNCSDRDGLIIPSSEACDKARAELDLKPVPKIVYSPNNPLDSQSTDAQWTTVYNVEKQGPAVLGDFCKKCAVALYALSVKNARIRKHKA